MKTLLFFGPFLHVLFFSVLTGVVLMPSRVVGQTVSSGTEKVDQKTLPGLSLSLPIEGKFVENEWVTLLKSYGRVTTGRNGVYKVPSATISALSSNPVNVSSKVSTERNKATIFFAVDKGNAEYINAGSEMYDQAETLLKDFAERTRFNYDIKLANDAFNESQKKQDKLTRQSEKLVREIERNKKEKENLIKKMDENARELEQLLRDSELNKSEQVTSLRELESKKQALEEVKAKSPK